ncbi:hypothetical protein [Aliiroseovarius sp. 2305UL8-7]|uniref:hypothetical protein n=1 Tax=Aliiroseovarius conchicola TaxID=3121637 RepID=UPI003526E909
MIRVAFAYFLAFAVTIASFALADARGTHPDLENRIEMVICTGVGMTTLVIGPDGEPVESIHLCPDGAQIFAAEFTVPTVYQPEGRLVASVQIARRVSLEGRAELIPSARGPPTLI